MLHKLSSHKLLSLTVGLLFSLVILACFFFTPKVSSQNIRLRQDLERHFLQHQTLNLDAAAVATQVKATGRLSLVTEDARFDLELTPHDIRGFGYRAEEFGADGVDRMIDTGAVHTFKGRVQGVEGAQARFTIDENGIEGLIITPAERYFVEPARDYSTEASAADYVMYKESDVVPSSSGACGVTLSEQVNQRAEAMRRENPQAISQTVQTSPRVYDVAPSVASDQSQNPDNQTATEATLLELGIGKDHLSWQATTDPKESVWQKISSKAGKHLEPPAVQTPLAPGCLAEAIRSGQQLNRTLAPGCAFQGGQLTERFRFAAAAGQQVSITMSSNVFDTYLYLYYSPVLADEDDNGAGGTNSRIPAGSGTITLPRMGYYDIYATSVLPNQTGNYSISFSSTVAPNDSFANAQLISGSSDPGYTFGNNANATKEAGEPNHGGNAGGASVWFRWQAPTGGTVTFTTSGSDFDTLLGVYTGSSVSSLTTIASNDDDPVNGWVQSVATFNAISGTEYFIAVDGYNAATGSIELRWSPGPTPTPTPTPTPLPPQELRVATEADNEYVVARGGAAAADREILSIMNQVEGLYEIELGLTMRVVYQSAWSTANNPYNSTNPSALLGELTDYWTANRGSVARDVVHMWSGKQLDNATIGTAYLDALCRYAGSGRAAYGLSKGVPGVQQISITAHEIGHNLGATHPNQQEPPVAECNNTVMSSSVSANPQLTFCQYSRDEIARYLSVSPGCLSAGTSQLSFGVATSFPVGQGPTSVAVGDFNGDGKEDIATSNFHSNDVSVLLGTDNGSFQTAVNYPVDKGPTSVAVGDFNGDGKKDLATANSHSNDVSVLLGTGSGTFLWAVDTPITINSMAVGDFNGDGKQDLVGVSGGSVRVLLATGTGAFELAFNYPIDNFSGAVEVGDVNGDGKQDLVVQDFASGLVNSNVSVLLGTGAGSFEAAVHIPDSAPAEELALADLNGDGVLDLVVIHYYFDEITVLLGTGTGSFQRAGTFQVGTHMSSLAVGDFNGDGKQDLAVTRDNTVSVLLGLGTGSFQAAVQYSTIGDAGSVAVGDFNGDGKQDLVTVSFYGDTVTVLLGTGTGSFPAAASYPALAYPQSVTTGDFNGDGREDIATANQNDIMDDQNQNGTVSVLLGTGTGSFQPTVNYPAGPNPVSVAVGDFNGDGKQDLVVANEGVFVGGEYVAGSGGVSVLLGTGAGSFSAPVSSPASGSFEVAAGEFNGDGKQDLAVIRANGVSVLLGTGTGSFEAPVDYPTGSSVSVAVGDFNRDGKQDLAVANFVYGDVGTVSVLLGTGTGSFQGAIGYPAGTSPGSVALGDFNGDGKQDLAVANADYIYGNLDTVSVLLGTGTGSFQPAVSFFVAGNDPLRVVVGDFNGDGRQDLAVTTADGGLSVLLGTGTGSFRAAVNYFVTGNTRSVAVGDFNGDGKQDLAISVFPGSGANLSGIVTVLLSTRGNSLNTPINDNFAATRVISGPTGTVFGTTVLATKELGEPNHASSSNGAGGASIWYRWTAPSTGKFYFQTFSSSFRTVIAFYTGSSLGSLNLVTASSSSVPEYVEFNGTAGTTYQIAIDGVTGDTGRTVLNWNTGSLSNDNFAFAREIRGSSGTVNGDNTNFTTETGEPELPGASAGFSAWYRWTAPNTGKVTFLTTPCGATTRLLGAYTGNFLDILSPVAVNYDGYRDSDDGGCDNRTLRFNAVAGASYRIQLRSTAGGPFALNWNYANPPPNDNFANALILAGNSGSLVGTNRDATKELGEPNHAGGAGGASVWYRWTAGFSGPVTFDTIGFRNQSANSFRYLTALLGVYTGSSLNGLSEVTASSSGNKVTFTATLGTTYQIAVDSGPYAGGGYLPGIIPLHWGPKQVANDDFANAQALAAAGSFSPLLGTNVGATKETGEPNHQGNAGGTSVWYRWTALSNGNASFIFNTCGTCSLSAGNALVAVYTGGNVNALTPVPTSPDNDHTFSGVRGTTYFIAVDSTTGAGGTYEFSLVSSNISARNDAYANAQVLSGSAGAVAGDNSGASKEIGEPNHANDIGGASVWYRWTAPASGLYTFDTFGSNFDTLLGVYTGNVVSVLSTVASSDNAGVVAQSRVTFNAIVDTTYYIAVDGKSTGIEQGTGLSRSQTGFILLNWNNLPPPVNDNFANAQVINGAAGNASGRNTVASKEGGEPNHAGNPGGASVWYQWTAPSSGSTTFNTFGSDFNTLLGVYTGNAVNALTQVSSNDDVGALTQSRVTFNAMAGTVYYIGVDGSVGVPGSVTPFTGNLVLSWFPELDGGNDSFAQAQTLSESSGSVAGTNVDASKEDEEPNHAGDRGGRSMWYSWTAPFNGPVLLTTAGSDFDTLLAVYTGTSVGLLTPVAGNDDSPYTDNLGHILTSSLTFTASAGTTYKIAVDGSGGRFGNFALRWGPEAKISGQVSFLGGLCGTDKKVSMILSGEDARAVSFTGSGTYSFQHLRVGGNYSVRGVSEISASCLPLFLERAKSYFPLAGDVLDANFIDDSLRGGGSTSNITGQVTNAGGLGLNNVAIALSGTAARTVYTDNAGLYLLPDLPAGTYQVTPTKAGAVFSPASRDFTFSSGQTITDADFGTQDSYNISGQTKVSNGPPLSGVTVTISNGTQPSTVLTDENGYYSFDAVTGGSYTITAAKAGLSFSPATRNISGLNANTKNFDFSASTQTQILTVMSANPNSGVNITVTPNDNNSQGNGATQFTRVYNSNANITLAAPATAGGNLFQKWLRDGVDFSTSQSPTVVMDADHTLTVVYITTVVSTSTGQNVTVQLNGVTVTFANVTGAGNTTIIPINPSAAGQLPNGYQLIGNSIAFDISTTAIVQPPITICFNVPAVTDATAFSQLRVLHNENGTLVDRTSSQDFATKMICASVNSLSPFVLATTINHEVQFNEASHGFTEGIGVTTITVNRLGETSGAATVNYASADGTASERSDYLAAVGTLRFAAGELSKTINVFVVNDSFGESPETFSITLSNPVGCTLGSPAVVTVTINSDESVNGLNPVREASFNTDFFVRQHYIDFFNREADASGLAFWKNQIDECTTPECREIRKINVSAAFFLSIEFQQTGYLVYKANQASFTSGEFLKLREFLSDTQEIGHGVVIGQPGAEAQLEANKQKFFMDFVQRAKFLDPAAYPTTMTAAQFVDKLNANTSDPLNPGSGGALSPSEHDALVSQLAPNSSSPTLRAQVLRSVSENSLFNSRQFNKAFVLMQYFGYLRRNPNDPPEAGLDFAGYNFWLGKLNQFNGNFVNAEMVKAFIVSGEYQGRFGP